MILALDLGTTCGFAIGEQGKCVMSGSRRLRKGEDKIEDMFWLIDGARAEHGIDRVYYETSTGYSYKSIKPLVSACYLRATVILWCTIRHATRHYVAAPTLKSFVGWSRKAGEPKDHLMLYARTAWPEAVITSQDQADALCVLSYAMECERDKQIQRRRRA